MTESRDHHLRPRAVAVPLLGLVLLLVIWCSRAETGRWPLRQVFFASTPSLELQVTTVQDNTSYMLAPATGDGAMARLAVNGLVATHVAYEMNAFILLFRMGADGSVLAAGTVPFDKVWNGNVGEYQWSFPGDLIVHAARQVLAADIPADRPALRLELSARASATAAPELDAGNLQVTGSTDAIGGVDLGQLLASLEPISLAVMTESGYRPTPRADAALRVEVTPRKGACDLLVTLGGRSLEMRHVPLEQSYDCLARLLLALQCGPAIVGVSRPGTHALSLVGAADGVVAIRQGGDVQALDMATGRLLWPIPTDAPKWTPPPTVVLTDATGAPVYVGLNLRGDWGRLVPHSGELAAAAPGGRPAAGTIALAADGRLCVAAGNDLALVDGDRDVWRHALPSPVTGGPCRYGAGFLAICADGSLVQASPDGTLSTWPAGHLTGSARLTVVGDTVLVIGERAIELRRPGDGGTAPSLGTTDSIKSCTALSADAFLVLTGDNVLHRHTLPAGEVLTRRWPTWVRGVSLLGDGPTRRIAVADMAGDLHLLDPATLETGRRLSLGTDLLEAPHRVRLPLPWPPQPNGPPGTAQLGKSGEVTDDPLSLKQTLALPDARAVYVFADHHGFVYMLDPELP